MPYEHIVTRRIEFSETDMAGIVHFANFFRYMEYAEHDFYRTLGHSVIMPHTEPPLGFPRVHASCDYRKPIRFEDHLEIHLLVREKRARVLSYVFKFRHKGEEIARGALTVVCVSHRPGHMEAVPIPAALADQIQAAPPELLV